MYRRPILCTLHGAVDFLKFLKIAVVGGGGVLLGCNVYIMSQYFSPNAIYWTASSVNRTRAPPDRMWTLYHWAMESVHSMGVLVIYYVPVLLSKCQILICIVRESNPGPPDRMWTLYHWAMESVHNMGVLVIHYVPVLLSKCQILNCIVQESNPGPPW